MHPASRAFIVAATACLLASCGGASLSQAAHRTQGATVAVVSLSINDYGNSLQGWNSAMVSDLMYSRAATMVQMTESELSRYWRVIPAPQFVGNPAYQELAGMRFEVAVPQVDGHFMPVFAMDRRQLIRAQVSPDQAYALAQATGADLVAIVYAEWGVVTGGVIPTSKSLSKNVIGIFDSGGNQVYRRRADARGSKTLGAFGRVVVDENSIDQWVEAFHKGMTRIFDS
jgi:hypothetical protein